MTYSALGLPSNQTLTLKDSISIAVGKKDGFTYCGAREYAISTNPPTYYSNVLQLAGNVLTLGLPTSTLADIGDYEI